MALVKNIVWATNTTFPASTDPWSAAPNKTEPSSLRKAQGFIPEAPFSADELNWWMNGVGGEITRIDEKIDLPTIPDMRILFLDPEPGSFLGAHYSPMLKLWFMFGIDDSGVGMNWESKDGEAWARNDDYGLASVWFTDAASNELGTTVFASNSRIIWTIDKGYILGQHAADNGGDSHFVKGFAHTSVDTPDGASAIIYDPVSALFCWVGRVTGSANVVSTSPDGSTWTVLFPATAFDGTFPITKLAANKVGRIVALQSCKAAGTSKTLRSDDGGLTWTAGPTLTHAFNPAQCSLDFTASGEFIASFTKSSGHIGEVWSSTNNGVSWSRKTFFATATPLVVVGWPGMWVAAVKHVPLSGETERVSLVLSRDKGVTWTDLPGYYPELLNVVKMNGRIYVVGYGPNYKSQYVYFPDVNVIT